MENWQWGLILKPFVALIFLLIARYLAVRILDRLPEGRIKRILSIRW